MSSLLILSPLAGWAASLDEAPDPVFAQRMLGDGVVVDPLSADLRAPCDGEIISVAASRHAIAIRAANGAEILMHVGIDTVALGGEGFELHVAQGDRVRCHDRLLCFDLDLLARKAKSLITPVIVTNAERFTITAPQLDREVRQGEVLFEIEPLAAVHAVAGDEAAAPETVERIVVEHEHGLHARPAALIANYVRTLPFEVEVLAHGRTANARSAVALMSLGIRGGDEITVVASDAKAAEAIAAIARLIRSLEAPSHTPKRPAMPDAPRTGLCIEGTKLKAVIASRGLAVGNAFHLREAEIAVSEAGQGVAHESAELDRAREEVRARLQQLARGANDTAREVINAHLEFVDDWELVTAARRSIERGKSAAFAWRSAVRESADTLKALGDARLAERVDDLLDLERQVLVVLLGQTPGGRIEVPPHAIILADELKPSQFVALDASRLAGICLAAGGPTSHVAILAAAVGVPMLVAAGPTLLSIADGSALILDAEQGVLNFAPDANELDAARRVLAVRGQRMAAERSAAQNDCSTADGRRIEVLANLGSLADAKFAAAQGAEGCGLLRTEFLFLERTQAPDEDEQARCYQEIAQALGTRPIVIRTLDIGGDKPIAYLPLPVEENPALGLRGVRTSLWRPDLLRTQVRAVLRVRPAGQCRLLLPMITELSEIRAVRRLVDEVRAELAIAGAVQIGAMIETPASAVLAEQIAGEVDFLSIGTNDLTQYALAMDRGHAELAARIDALHPAVLRLIAMAAQAGARHECPVAVCGGLASDPVAVPVLLGLGVNELSVVPAVIPQLKHLIATLTLERCRTLAQRALQQESAEAVRTMLVGAQSTVAVTTGM